MGRLFKNWPKAALLTLGTGIALRLVYCNAPLVSDELASASIWAQMPFWTIPLNYQNTNNHILNTLLLGIGLRLFGANHFMLRLPVMFSGVFSLWLGYATAWKMTRNKHIALGALLLLTFSGIHIIHSTEARGYILVMALAQWIVYILLSRLQGGQDLSDLALEERPVPTRWLFSLWILCFLGTWTMPTFIILEGSLLLFFGGLLLLKFRERSFDFRFSCCRLSLVFLLGLAAYAFQYYILIPGEMLKGAYSFANSPSGMKAPILIHEILKNLVSPLHFLSLPFLVLMLIGMFSLLPNQKNLCLLFFCLLVFIPLVIQIINFFSFFSINPPPRIFNYLQPFFFTGVSMGLYYVLEGTLSLLKRKAGFQAGLIKTPALFFLFFVPVIFLSARELKNHVYPERASRPPFQKVKEFIEGSGPNDLFLTSHRPHIWFYLYGANAMRKRVYHIIDTGELGRVYFLEYISGRDSDIKRIRRRGIEFFQMKDYALITRRSDGKSDALVLPASLFRLAADFGFCRIYQVRSECIRKNYALRNRKDFERWETYALHPRELKPLEALSKKTLSLRFQGPVALYSETRDASRDSSFALDLHILCKDNTRFQALYVNGKMGKTGILMQPSWVANDWVLGHPYGPRIFNRPLPTFSLSFKTGPIPRDDPCQQDKTPRHRNDPGDSELYPVHA